MTEFITRFSGIDRMNLYLGIVGVNIIDRVWKGTESDNFFADVDFRTPTGIVRRRMFVKKLDRYKTNQCQEGKGESILQKHAWLLRNNFPIIPELYYLQQKEWLIVPDVTDGGRIVIIDKHNLLPTSGLHMENIDEITEGIRTTAINTHNNGEGMYLGLDAYAVRVDKMSGIGILALLDIGTNSHLLNGSKSIFSGETLPIKQAQWVSNYFIKDILGVKGVSL